MRSILTFLLYILPFLGCLFYAYVIFKDERVARKMEIETYIGLAVLLFASVIPIVNLGVIAMLLFMSSITGAFDHRFSIHNRK